MTSRSTPHTAQQHLARALVHDRASREIEAIPHYQAALRLGLNAADRRIALICLASSHREVGEYDTARTVIERARRVYRHDPVIDAFAGLILFDAGEHQRAIQILGLALCEHVDDTALAGFSSALVRKFRSLTRTG